MLGLPATARAAPARSAPALARADALPRPPAAAATLGKHLSLIFSHSRYLLLIDIVTQRKRILAGLIMVTNDNPKEDSVCGDPGETCLPVSLLCVLFVGIRRQKERERTCPRTVTGQVCPATLAFFFVSSLTGRPWALFIRGQWIGYQWIGNMSDPWLFTTKEKKWIWD